MKDKTFLKISNRDIYDRINESDKSMVLKFNEVIMRQNKTNGRLTLAESKILSIEKSREEKSRSFEDWSRKKLIYIGGIVMTIIMFLSQLLAQIILRN